MHSSTLTKRTSFVERPGSDKPDKRCQRKIISILSQRILTWIFGIIFGIAYVSTRETINDSSTVAPFTWFIIQKASLDTLQLTTTVYFAPDTDTERHRRVNRTSFHPHLLGASGRRLWSTQSPIYTPERERLLLGRRSQKVIGQVKWLGGNNVAVTAVGTIRWTFDDDNRGSHLFLIPDVCDSEKNVAVA